MKILGEIELQKGHVDVCHLTSAHDRTDTRIFQKMCLSLHNYGYTVVLVVSDGKPEDTVDGVRVIGLPKISSRFLRMIVAPYIVFLSAIKVRAKLYHFHDPELLVACLLLRLFTRAKVIYDSHEDLPATIYAKTYIPSNLRGVISKISNSAEKMMAARMHAIIAATPHIQSKFKCHHDRVVDVCNFPIQVSAPLAVAGPLKGVSRISYVGNLGVNRGIIELIAALPLCKNNVRLDICGAFSEKGIEQTTRENAGWEQVDFHGWVDEIKINTVLQQSSAGIVTLKPTPNYIHALPIKMFEYMRAGLPVIASNFDLWKKIILKHECGIVVDPESPEEIAKAIDFVIENPILSLGMGKNGSKAVESVFNWSIEEKKLIGLYEELI